MLSDQQKFTMPARPIISPKAILLADDYTMLLDAFRRLLEPWGKMVGAVCDDRALVDLAASTRPDDRPRHLDAAAQRHGRLSAASPKNA